MLQGISRHALGNLSYLLQAAEVNHNLIMDFIAKG